MGGFNNPVVGGSGTLVRQAMQSAGFTAGVSGWRIARDGTAEFNGATFRGNVVLDGTGTLLVYDSAGVIIVAISPAGGTDPLGSGQTYQPGIDTYAQSGGSPTYEVNIRNGFITFNYVSATLFTQRGLVQANEPLDVTRGPSLGVYSPSDSPDQRQAAVVCYGTSKDGTEAHHINLTGIDPLAGNAPINTTVNARGTLNVSGVLTVAGDDVAGAWTPFTPAWTASTTTPSLGNGTVDAAYKAIGQSVHFRIKYVFGSGTTFGSGAWGFGLPAAIAPVTDQVAAVVLVDSAPSNRLPGTAWLTAASGIFRVLVPGGSFGVSSTVPFTWAAGDELLITGTYER